MITSGFSGTSSRTFSTSPAIKRQLLMLLSAAFTLAAFDSDHLAGNGRRKLGNGAGSAAKVKHHLVSGISYIFPYLGIQNLRSQGIWLEKGKCADLKFQSSFPFKRMVALPRRIKIILKCATDLPFRRMFFQRLQIIFFLVVVLPWTRISPLVSKKKMSKIAAAFYRSWH